MLPLFNIIVKQQYNYKRLTYYNSRTTKKKVQKIIILPRSNDERRTANKIIAV